MIQTLKRGGQCCHTAITVQSCCCHNTRWRSAAGLPLFAPLRCPDSLPPKDVWGGTIWQEAVCHVGELAPGACANGQASVTPLTGPAQVTIETDGDACCRGSGDWSESRTPYRTGAGRAKGPRRGVCVCGGEKREESGTPGGT